MMHPPQRVLRPLIVVALVASLLGGTTHANAALPRGSWNDVAHAHASGQDSYLYDSWSDGTDVWAAGVRRINITGTFEWRTWVQRCDGAAGTCQLQNTPDVEGGGAPAYTFLHGVTGTSATDVWVAGWGRGPGGAIRPLTEHYNGIAWSIVPTPSMLGSLWGISAASASDVWAVGADNRVAFHETPLALRWNGASWSESPVQVAGCRGTGPLVDVDATGTRPLAVGSCINDDGEEQAMLIGRRAGRWTLEPITGIDPTTFDLQSVNWTGRMAWAGGSTASGAVVLRLQNGVWSPVPVPDAASAVYGFAGSGGEVWAVGLTDPFGRLTMHWNGKRWRLVTSPGLGWLESVTRTADGTPWAVGQIGGQSLIQRFDQSG